MVCIFTWSEEVLCKQMVHNLWQVSKSVGHLVLPKCRKGTKKRKYFVLAAWSLDGMILRPHMALFTGFARQEITLVRFSKAGSVFVLGKHYHWHLKIPPHGKSQIGESPKSFRIRPIVNRRGTNIMQHLHCHARSPISQVNQSRNT